MNKLEDWFYNESHRMKCHKWIHYFDIYDKHFKAFRKNKKVRVLEIGVFNGGSLEMWDKYFPKSEIVGIDINPDCLKLQKNFRDNVQIVIGDQANPNFWNEFKSNHKPFDIIIDDGGHRMNQQETTFDCMFDHVTENGIILVEDTHTSYWHHFGGGLKRESSFIEKSKDLIDSLHIHHFKPNSEDYQDKKRIEFHSKVKSISFYDSAVVYEKGLSPLPEAKNL